MDDREQAGDASSELWHCGLKGERLVQREICPRDVEDFLRNFTIFMGELTVAPYKHYARFALRSQFSLHGFDLLSACECGVGNRFKKVSLWTINY